jgi:hypothetical protein
MDPRSATGMYSKPHKKSGCGDQAKRPAVLDINSTGKTAAKREQNRLAAVKCRARKRSNVEKISERSRKLSAISCVLKQQIQILQDELSMLRTYALDHQWCNCGIARYNHIRTADLATKSDPSVALPTAFATVSHVSAPTMLWAATQAGVQCDPGVLTSDLTSAHENQVCPGEGGPSRDDTQAYISISSKNGSFDTPRNSISSFALVSTTANRRPTNHQ